MFQSQNVMKKWNFFARIQIKTMKIANAEQNDIEMEQDGYSINLEYLLNKYNIYVKKLKESSHLKQMQKLNCIVCIFLSIAFFALGGKISNSGTVILQIENKSAMEHVTERFCSCLNKNKSLFWWTKKGGFILPPSLLYGPMSPSQQFFLWRHPLAIAI